MNRFRTLLVQATRAHRAVGAFTAYDLWQLAGIVAATDRLAAPGIVLLSSTTFATHGAAEAAACSAYLQHINSSLLVQADHLPTMELVACAWRSGAEAALADGSRMSLRENAVFVQKARAIAQRPREAGIEAELGRLDGDEDRLTAESAGKLTDPHEVARFVQESDIDCLAVSIGNRHGAYEDPPNLDWDRLTAIRGATPIPLALHGASGLPDEDLRRAVANGIGKVNFNAELRETYFAALKRRAPEHESSLDLASLGRDLTQATSTIVETKLRLLGWGRE